MSFSISIIPDRLAHYRVPVFNNISNNRASFELIVYADLRPDASRIKKPAIEDLSGLLFTHRASRDIRIFGRLLISTGSIMAALDSSNVIILWGDAFSPGNWVSVFLAKLKNKKIIFWTHGLYGNESLFKKKVRCLFYSLGDSLLLYGNYSKVLLMAENFPASKLYLINNALDFSAQNQRYEKYNSWAKSDKGNTLKLIFVGRLTKVKKLHLLLIAVKMLTEKISLKVDIIGDGDAYDRLQSLTLEMGLTEAVSFHGAIYDEDKLSRLILVSDIMVSPGNVGLTAMHSLVYGTPVISHSNASSQMPEFEAIEPGISGELFDEDDVNSLCESVLRCNDALVEGKITDASCRKVLEERYSLVYQRKVFNECLKVGLGINEI
jgi:glycosyltransferase involved in cell wall biosynthesis